MFRTIRKKIGYGLRWFLDETERDFYAEKPAMPGFWEAVDQWWAKNYPQVKGVRRSDAESAAIPSSQSEDSCSDIF